MANHDNPVIIVGAGIAGLSCARKLHRENISFKLLEATSQIGGRVKTDHQDGFLLDRGFQVLQTAYPEARRTLNYSRLRLQGFAPGAMVRIGGRVFTIADPLRKPARLFETVTAPIGTFRDRIRLLRLVHEVNRMPLERLFDLPEESTMEFLRTRGFSETMIARFFVPFFGGVCLDPQIGASSRVFRYVLRMFAAGDAALPLKGMAQIPRQLAEGLPQADVLTGMRVRHVNPSGVTLVDGTALAAGAVVISSEAPATVSLLNLTQFQRSVPETCLYFSCPHTPAHPPYLLLNGNGRGPINNVVFPSSVSPAYAPRGKSLASVVVLGHEVGDPETLLQRVKVQLLEWFGSEAAKWRHLATYEIRHALPDQSPPTENPYRLNPMVRPGIFVCGEHGSLPGIQWAMVSGRRAAEAVIAYLA
ncbi:MAG: NAD(P)/FAD-dependent oxidoreductase [Desulfobacterales bacterium]